MADYCQPPYVSTSLYRHTHAHTHTRGETDSVGRYIRPCIFTKASVDGELSHRDNNIPAVRLTLLRAEERHTREMASGGYKEGLPLRTNYQLQDELALFGAFFSSFFVFFSFPKTSQGQSGSGY